MSKTENHDDSYVQRMIELRHRCVETIKLIDRTFKPMESRCKELFDEISGTLPQFNLPHTEEAQSLADIPPTRPEVKAWIHEQAKAKGFIKVDQIAARFPSYSLKSISNMLTNDPAFKYHRKYKRWVFSTAKQPLLEATAV